MLPGAALENHPGGHRGGLGSLCKAGFRERVVKLVASLGFSLPTDGSGEHLVTMLIRTIKQYRCSCGLTALREASSEGRQGPCRKFTDLPVPAGCLSRQQEMVGDTSVALSPLEHPAVRLLWQPHPALRMGFQPRCTHFTLGRDSGVVSVKVEEARAMRG